MTRNETTVPLPSDWPRHVQAAVLHVISLARLAFIGARGRAAWSRKAHERLMSDLEALREEIALLRREIEIKDLRMSRIHARRRPHYRPVERLAILELRAARGWSRREAARRFLLQPATLSAWVRRAEEGGGDSLLEAPEPVNRLPEFVRRVARKLKALCPAMGKKRIAQTLARAGLALAVSTVGRILEERGRRRPGPDGDAAREPKPEVERAPGNPVQARKPNDVWEIDLTVVPTRAGLWTPWIPFSIAQLWPFSWWVACVVDRFSRQVLGFEVFGKEPDSRALQALASKTAAKTGAKPRYLVTDKGRQFDCRGFRAWCRHRGVLLRYAAAGSLRATAVIERFHRSFKVEWLRCIQVPLRCDAMRREIACYLRWFHVHRPHQGLGGRTPGEVYEDARPATTASPTLDRHCPLELHVRFHEGRKQLPIIELKRVA